MSLFWITTKWKKIHYLAFPRQKIQKLSESTGVQVHSVCADYFMEAPLHRDDPDQAQASLNAMRRLLEAAADLEIRDIVCALCGPIQHRDIALDPDFNSI